MDKIIAVFMMPVGIFLAIAALKGGSEKRKKAPPRFNPGRGDVSKE